MMVAGSYLSKGWYAHGLLGRTPGSFCALKFLKASDTLELTLTRDKDDRPSPLSFWPKSSLIHWALPRWLLQHTESFRFTLYTNEDSLNKAMAGIQISEGSGDQALAVLCLRSLQNLMLPWKHF